MLQLSNGVIFPGFIIYLILYIIMRLMPDSFVRFQKHHAPMSFPIVNFSLPFDVNEDNWPRVKRTGRRIFCSLPASMHLTPFAPCRVFMKYCQYLTAELQGLFLPLYLQLFDWNLFGHKEP